MKIAYGKQHRENSTSNQNTSVFKDSGPYQADIKVETGKLEVINLSYLAASWATLGETDLVGCFQCQAAGKTCCYAILGVTEVITVRRSETTTRLQIQCHTSCLKGLVVFPNTCSSLGLTNASTKQLCRSIFFTAGF